jgi:hypothetical protein
MGLDLSCGVSFSYGGFHCFRSMLAKEINIDIENMEGFGGNKSFNDIKDDIKILLDHSDCNGFISPEDCGKIAPRLRELTKKWVDSQDENKKWYGRQALFLAEGLESCYKNNEPLLFK